ncbi:hypothetical protein [Kangiella geojedonensis]|uniref:Uncharacterized protein n=1 Tax=Kangiella geojedonensis TaxID=914150 RepID=A0A0F6TPT8_9GAMM|nr:hypothetical protein [Kangiella geojedonensis]AKE51309.1 hypothetical protein TQ33_0321 [Kangiella geojedonensis]
MDLKLTEFLAIYGAVLSSFVFLWNVLKSRRKVAVKLIYGLEGEEDDIKTGVYVFIKNPSAQVVHISGLSILHPWRKTNIFKVILESIKHRRWFSTYGWVHSSLSLYKVDDGCPISIEPGHSHKVLIPDDVLSEILEDSVSREIMASVQEQLWNETCSKPFELQEFQ